MFCDSVISGKNPESNSASLLYKKLRYRSFNPLKKIIFSILFALWRRLIKWIYSENELPALIPKFNQIELVFNDAGILDSLNKSNNSILVLTGNGSKLFNKNSFHLDGKYNFKEINFYQESDIEICKAGLNFENYWSKNEYLTKKNKKKIGFFESFFNFFNR